VLVANHRETRRAQLWTYCLLNALPKYKDKRLGQVTDGFLLECGVVKKTSVVPLTHEEARRHFLSTVSPLLATLLGPDYYKMQTKSLWL
jgi:hypothetical protein